MKVNFKFLAMALLLFMPVMIFAQDEPIDFGDSASVLTWLSPLITLGVTFLIKKIMPFVTGTTTLIVVPLVSSGIAYLGTVIQPDSSWLLSFLVGLGAVFLNQLSRTISGNA